MFRRLYRRYRWLMLGFSLLYIVTCALLMTSLHSIDGRPRFQRFFERVFDPFESITNRQCSLEQKADLNYVVNENPWTLTYDTGHVVKCYAHDVREWPPDIDMEDVWDTVSVGYPKLVMTVTGWVEPVHVLSYTPKPLHVIVMPHSHQDPGWLNTLDRYFFEKTKTTLDLMVEKLIYFPDRKFVWTEVVFLEMWWNMATGEQRKKFKTLLSGGQLEILTGGWVMTDESVAHYGAMLNQLTEGHLWLNQTLGITVDNGWAIDPFGHSSTMSYILAQAGITTNVIQRAHFAIKRHLASTKSLEFYWKQHWDQQNTRRVRTHLMPFLLYGIPYTCGPDRTVCCKFDFYKAQCFHGSTKADKLKVDDTNVAELSQALWEQLQKKSELFRNKVLLVPHGDDFRFNNEDEWDLQFGYLRKIMKYINGNQSMNMKIQFGTLADYFKAVGKQPDSLKYHEYPTLSGDLYPYSDRGDQYWSGFYSARPFYKHMVRKLQAQLRCAEMLFTFCLSKLSVDASMKALYKRLEVARRGLALYQHHDAITGTCRKNVVVDYGTRLKNAMNAAQIVYKESTIRLLQSSTGDLQKEHERRHFDLRDTYNSYNTPPKLILLKVGLSPAIVVVTNSLGYRRQELVQVLVNRSGLVVTTGDFNVVRHQISPVWTGNHRVNNGQFMLSFEADLEPFSIYTYAVGRAPITRENAYNIAKIFNFTISDTNTGTTVNSYPFLITHERRSTLAFSNKYLTAYFSSCDGMLKSVRNHGDDTDQRSDVHFVAYTTGERVHPFKDKSGAYTFIPDGPARELNIHHPVILVTRGPLFTEVRAVYRDIVHTATIYNVSGSQGKGIHIENVININNESWNNQELVMRIETDVRDSQHSFCTDTNGFQLHRRKTRTKMTIQGNFYPVTTMAILENDHSRFSLMTASSHGIASLVSGWLEVVLDRRLLQDDWRGLGQNVTDNVPTGSSFFILFEKKNIAANSKVPKLNRLCLPSTTSDHLSESLNNPLLVLFSSITAPRWGTTKLNLAGPFPCDLHVVNLRMLSIEVNSNTKEALLVLHRKGYDCDFPQVEDNCPSKKKQSVADLTFLDVTRLEETTLTGTRLFKKLDITAPLDLPAMAMKTYKLSLT